MNTTSLRIGALLVCALPLLACRGDAPPAADAAVVADAAPADAPAPAATRWAGDATGGYTGNRISFTLAEGGAEIRDLTFTGHWDCSDGIEQTTLGPEAAFPVASGKIDVESVDPPDGGATAIRFVMTGQITGATAAGKLRVNLNALGCDTRELSWTATPVAG